MAEPMFQYILQDQKFCGDKNTICVEDFLDTLDILFYCQNLDAKITDEGKRERAKLLTL